jgi:zinc protease
MRMKRQARSGSAYFVSRREKLKNLRGAISQAGLDTRKQYCRFSGRGGSLIGAILILLVLCPCVRAAGTDSEVSRITLDNGLRVVVVRSLLAPVVSIVTNYMVGSNEAPEGFPGMAHAQEHMMFRGSPGLTAGQLADIMAAMGGKFNADTQQTVTQYFFTVTAEDLDVALHIERIRMSGVLDTGKLWDAERGAIEQEVAQDLSIPEYIFYTKLLAAMFRGTPYAHSPLGSVGSFDKTTGQMLKTFYDTWYVPNNAVLVIVGDVEPQATIARVKEMFGPIPTREIPKKPEVKLEPLQPETFSLETDQPFGMIAVSFRMPGYDSNDYAASVVLSDVLSSQRGKLYSLVPQGKALYAGFSLSTLPRAGLGYAVVAFPQGADPQPLLVETRKILADEINNGFDTDLVAAAKRQEVMNAQLQKNSVQGLAMAWSQALAVEGRHSPDDDVEAIQHVTPEEVGQVAKRYMDLDNALVTILTPSSSGKTLASKAPGGLESFTPEHTSAVKLPGWAAEALQRLSVPKSTLKPVVTKLPNGLLLIVQPENVSQAVSVYGHIRNKSEMEAPEGQEGVDQVLEQLLSYGTTTLDRLAFQAALDEIGASESAGTDFSLDVLADKFDRGVQLLADNQLNPALPEEAFRVVQEQVAATVAGQLHSPGYLTQRALDKGLFPEKDPSLRQATPETVKSLTLTDVQNYYRKVFRPDLTTIVAIGRTTPEEAYRIIDKYFGDWKAVGPKPDVLLPTVPLNKPSIFSVPDAQRIQDKVVLAETLGLTRSNPDYYALQLGNHVLGGGFYATRLFHDLRETTGLVYSVSSELDVKRTRGLYAVEYACDPTNVAKARAIIIQNLNRMQNEPVDQEDLQRARALLVRKIPLSESSVDDIAHKFISQIELDLPLDEPIVAAGHYLELKAEDVQAAFRKWIRPDDLVQVTQGPAPR